MAGPWAEAQRWCTYGVGDGELGLDLAQLVELQVEELVELCRGAVDLIGGVEQRVGDVVARRGLDAVALLRGRVRQLRVRIAAVRDDRLHLVLVGHELVQHAGELVGALLNLRRATVGHDDGGSLQNPEPGDALAKSSNTKPHSSAHSRTLDRSVVSIDEAATKQRKTENAKTNEIFISRSLEA